MKLERNSQSEVLDGAVSRSTRVDRAIRFVTAASWLLVLGAVGTYAVVASFQLRAMMKLHAQAGLPWWASMIEAKPLLTVLGIFFLAAAIVGSLSLLARARTASLADLQRRLISLENLLMLESEESERDEGPHA
jgi:hypothetical protein